MPIPEQPRAGTGIGTPLWRRLGGGGQHSDNRAVKWALVSK